MYEYGRLLSQEVRGHTSRREQETISKVPSGHPPAVCRLVCALGTSQLAEVCGRVTRT